MKIISNHHSVCELSQAKTERRSMMKSGDAYSSLSEFGCRVTIGTASSINIDVEDACSISWAENILHRVIGREVTSIAMSRPQSALRIFLYSSANPCGTNEPCARGHGNCKGLRPMSEVIGYWAPHK